MNIELTSECVAVTTGESNVPNRYSKSIKGKVLSIQPAPSCSEEKRSRLPDDLELVVSFEGKDIPETVLFVAIVPPSEYFDYMGYLPMETLNKIFKEQGERRLAYVENHSELRKSRVDSIKVNSSYMFSYIAGKRWTLSESKE